MGRNDFLINNEDLKTNPTARIPICLCLDSSGSMRGEKLNMLNQGVAEFYNAIKSDAVAIHAAEICTVQFGDEAEALNEFSTIDLQPEVPIVKAFGGTSLGKGVLLALEKLNNRKEEYKKVGVDYYQPWLVLMTDGRPNSSEKGRLATAQETISQLVNDRKLTVFPIAIGEDADIEVLKSLSPKWDPLRLKGLRFSEFFTWLSVSVAAVSRSQPTDNVKLDVEGLKGWAEL